MKDTDRKPLPPHIVDALRQQGMNAPLPPEMEEIVKQMSTPPDDGEAPEADDEVRAPAGAFKVSHDQGSFFLDPIEALQEINRIAEKRQGAKNFEWLEDFRDWLKLRSGQALPLGAVDALWDELRGKYNLAKKKRLERLNSLISTTSSPAEPAS